MKKKVQLLCGEALCDHGNMPRYRLGRKEAYSLLMWF